MLKKESRIRLGLIQTHAQHARLKRMDKKPPQVALGLTSPHVDN